MKKELVVKENKIDWLGIIELALKKQDWGKKFVLFVCDDVSITCTMYEFKY